MIRAGQPAHHLSQKQHFILSAAGNRHTPEGTNRDSSSCTHVRFLVLPLTPFLPRVSALVFCYQQFARVKQHSPLPYKVLSPGTIYGTSWELHLNWQLMGLDQSCALQVKFTDFSAQPVASTLTVQHYFTCIWFPSKYFQIGEVQLSYITILVG